MISEFYVLTCCVIGFTFLFALVAKLISFSSLNSEIGIFLNKDPLKRPGLLKLLSAIIIISETCIVLLLLSINPLGLILSTIAFSFFTAYLLLLKKQSPGARCLCFGTVLSGPVSNFHIIRNAVYIALSSIFFILGTYIEKSGYIFSPTIAIYGGFLAILIASIPKIAEMHKSVRLI